VSPEDRLRLGAQANQLLNDPLLVKAFDDVKAGIVKQIEDSNFRQTKEREQAYQMLRALSAVKGQIESHVRTAMGVQADRKETERATVARVVEQKPRQA